MKVNKQQLRNLIFDVISEVTMQGKNVEVAGGNIFVDNVEFKVRANAGIKTAYQFVDVSLDKIEQTNAGLKVVGTALGVEVDDIVNSEKINAITDGVDSGENEFKIQGELALFKFSRVL